MAFGDVLGSFASPGTNPRGLAWDGTNLWNSDVVADTIYKLNPADGSVLDSFASPSGAPRGLAWDGTNLWHCNSFGPTTIYKLNPADGSVLDSFASPGSSPIGLAWDGTNLWNSDVGTDTIYKLDPADGSVLDSFSAPAGDVQGLAWDGTNLWSSDAGTDTIYKLDPADGSILDSFASPGSGPQGLAWDGTNLWNSDFSTATIYQLDVSQAVAMSANLTGTSTLTANLRIATHHLSAALTGQGILTAPLAVIRQLSANLAGEGSLSPNLLTPEWVRFHLGVFAAVMPPFTYDGYRDADGAMVWRPLELVDRSHFWRSDSTPDPVTIDTGTNIATYVRDDLAVRFNEMDTDGVEDNGVTAAQDYVFDAGTPWLDIYNTLLGAAGQEPLHADVDGKPTSAALVDPESRTSEHTYSSGTTIVPAVKIESVNPELPNVLRFIGKRWGGKTTEGDGIRTVVNETTGPGSRRQRGGKTVLLRVEVDAQTQDDLDAQARALAPFYFGGGGLRYVGQVGLNPRHDDSDVVTIEREALGLSGTWLVTGWTVNLGDADTMRVMDLELEQLTGAAFLSETPVPTGAYGTFAYGTVAYGGLE